MSSTVKLAESYAKANLAVQHKRFLRLVALLNIEQGFRCLDIGCGTGLNTAHLADKVGRNGFVTGIDPDENRINIARKENQRENINWIVGRSTSLPEVAGGYDLIVSNCVMHWINYEEKLQTYEKVLEVLKDGGVFASVESSCLPHNLRIFLPFLSPRLRQGLVRYHLTVEGNRKIFSDLRFRILKLENMVHVESWDLDKFLRWSTASMNDERIDFHALYEENKEVLDIEMSKDGQVLTRFHNNYIVVQKN